MVANSVHRQDQSIDLGIYVSHTTLRPDLNEAVFRHAGSTSVVVFVAEHSIRMLAVHLAKVGVNITCQMLRVNVRTNELSPMTPHHTFMEKRCW